MMRTLVPVTYVEHCTPCAAQMPTANSATDDLSALLLLARALSNEKNEQPTAATNSDSSINVENIITKLINALVYTTTQSAGKGTSPVDCTDNKSSKGSCNSSATTAPKPSNSGENKNDGAGLIDLSLLDDNIADLDIAGEDVLDLDLLGLGSNKTESNNNSDSSGGLLDDLLPALL